MGDLTGLPDFALPLAATNASAYAPFGAGAYAVVPQTLALATNPDGTVRLALVFEQQAGDFSATGQYAVLDFTLAGDYDFDGCLASARVRDPNATVKPIAVRRGFARLCTTATQVQLPQDLQQPVALGLSGSGFARFTARLSATAGELVKGAMDGGSLLLSARVEFDALGVAPRAGAIVAFSPQALVAALTADAAGGPVAASDVLSALTSPASTLPLKVVSGNARPGDIAAALAPRMFAEYTTLVPAPGTTIRRTFHLQRRNGDDDPMGSQPAGTRRAAMGGFPQSINIAARACERECHRRAGALRKRAASSDRRMQRPFQCRFAGRAYGRRRYRDERRDRRQSAGPTEQHRVDGHVYRTG